MTRGIESGAATPGVHRRMTRTTQRRFSFGEQPVGGELIRDLLDAFDATVVRVRLAGAWYELRRAEALPEALAAMEIK